MAVRFKKQNKICSSSVAYSTLCNPKYMKFSHVLTEFWCKTVGDMDRCRMLKHTRGQVSCVSALLSQRHGQVSSVLSRTWTGVECSVQGVDRDRAQGAVRDMDRYRVFWQKTWSVEWHGQVPSVSVFRQRHGQVLSKNCSQWEILTSVKRRRTR